MLLLIGSPALLKAQREFGTCDSTEHPFNQDTTIIAGKYALYTLTSNGLDTLTDFTSPDPDRYIRDFDIINDNHWLTLIGSRYIGQPVELMKSNNRGASWTEDTSFYAATRSGSSSFQYFNSINQLQEVGTDTIVLFMGYYESGICYSLNNGLTWNNWFVNDVWTHYQGLLECDTMFYLYSFEGDAFRPWMFGFGASLLFSPDTAGSWQQFQNANHPPCSGQNHPDCIYASSSLNRCGQYQYFKNYTDSVCSVTTSLQEENLQQLKTRMTLSPNPATNQLTIKVNDLEAASFLIYDSTGKCVMNIHKES